MNTNLTTFFTQLYYPDMTTTAIIMTDLVEDLAAYGLDAEVVCAQPIYKEFRSADPPATARHERAGYADYTDKNWGIGRFGKMSES